MPVPMPRLLFRHPPPRPLPPRTPSKTTPPPLWKACAARDVTKAVKALLKDSAKRGGGSIQMRDVVKIYPGSTVHALDDFNLDIKPGEMVVLLGGSGCGKSTALRSLAGQDVTGVPVNKREMAWCSRPTRFSRT